MSKFSRAEFEAIRLKKKRSALEVSEIIRFAPETNFTSKFELELTPFLLEPIQLLRKKGVIWIGIIASTQTCKTTFLQIALADTISENPGNVLFIMPTEVTAKRGFLDKVVSMIKNTPEFLKRVLPPYKESLTFKICKLNNMKIYGVPGGSLADLRSISISLALIDELRLMPRSIGDESSTTELTEDRMTVFLEDGLAQGVMVTSPSTEEDAAFNEMNQPYVLIYELYVECPECLKMQRLNFFKHMFKNGEVRETCHCIFCDHKFDDSNHKKKMHKRYRWSAASLSDIQSGATLMDGKLYDDFQPIGHAKKVFFWLNSMNSPFRSFKTIYQKYMASKDDYIKYLNFLQSWLALFRKLDVSKAKYSDLEMRVCEVPQGVVPEWCQVITAGVDSQNYEFYYSVVAWGLGRIAVIDSGRIESMYTLDTSDVVRDIFLRYFENKIYYTESRKKWTIGLWAIDTAGGRTTQIYEATEGLLKCIRTKGRKIDTDYLYNSSLDLYFLYSKSFLDITDTTFLSENFTLYKGISKDYLTQCLNIRKIKETDKYGEDKSYYRSFGKTDYRFSLVYAFFAMRIPLTSGIIFNNEIHNEYFSYNPLLAITPIKENIIEAGELNKIKREEAGLRHNPEEVIRAREDRVYNNNQDFTIL